MRKDIETDFYTLTADTMRTIVKVIIASLVFIEVGHVEYSVAVSTACLLGMTDFFSKKRDLKTPPKIKAKVVTKFSSKTTIQASQTQTQSGTCRQVSVEHSERLESS